MIARWIRLIAGSALGAVVAGCAVLTPLPSREDVSKVVITEEVVLEGVVPTLHKVKAPKKDAEERPRRAAS